MKMMAGRVLLLAALAAGGCKGETVVKDNPETAQNLSNCEASLKEKVAYINTLNERITALESGGQSGAVEVTITGDIVEITAGKGKGPSGSKGDAKGDAKDAELYEAFVQSLKKSRGAIKKCYQSALKKNAALSAKSVRLNISVNYRTNGQVKSASFTPRVSEQFNQCMDGVAKNWQLPAMPRPVTFTYTQTLTPE